MIKLAPFYSEMPTCDHKHHTVIGNAGVLAILNDWQKADSERWEKVSKKVKKYTFLLDGKKYNLSGNSPEQLRFEFETQYRNDIKEAFEGEWWMPFLLLIANRGLYRAETTLEAHDKLLIKTDTNDINNVIQAQNAHIQQFYDNAIEANVEMAGLALLAYLNEIDEEYTINQIILNEQGKAGELRTAQIVNTQTTSIFNGATLVYYTRNYITRFKIETSDPCPTCEALAQDEYSYEQTQEYQISIDKSMEVTGYAMESSKKFYAQNPWAGLIPVHVNCQCFWTIV